MNVCERDVCEGYVMYVAVCITGVVRACYCVCVVYGVRVMWAEGRGIMGKGTGAKEEVCLLNTIILFIESIVPPYIQGVQQLAPYMRMIHS